MDKNSELYVLLRVGKWDIRKELAGKIGGALWIRHLAEVIRLAFEEVHATKWPEEDQRFGHWLAGGRRRFFGSERPLDDATRSKPYIAHRFGLFTGSSVRWYVEGHTEYGAISELLPEASAFGIELVNLGGRIADNPDNDTKPSRPYAWTRTSSPAAPCNSQTSGWRSCQFVARSYA